MILFEAYISNEWMKKRMESYKHNDVQTEITVQFIADWWQKKEHSGFEQSRRR
jgi:hypothetical protein